jgi:hypothetical protein
MIERVNGRYNNVVLHAGKTNQNTLTIQLLSFDKSIGFKI